MKDYVPGLEDELQVGSKPTSAESDSKEKGSSTAAAAEKKVSGTPEKYVPGADEPELIMETDSTGKMRLVIKPKQ